MRAVSVIAIMLLAGCANPQETADEAMGDMATELGRLTSNVRFTEIHVREDTVCGYADGQKFYSMIAGGSRLSTLVDQEVPETISETVERSFARCMNQGDPIEPR